MIFLVIFLEIMVIGDNRFTLCQILIALRYYAGKSVQIFFATADSVIFYFQFSSYYFYTFI